ncbi:hypothetical protein QTP88_026304 [Uroleucon formosanum]
MCKMQFLIKSYYLFYLKLYTYFRFLDILYPKKEQDIYMLGEIIELNNCNVIDPPSKSEVNAVRVPYYRDISNRPQRNFTDHDHGIIIEYIFLLIINYIACSKSVMRAYYLYIYARDLSRSLYRIGRVWVPNHLTKQQSREVAFTARIAVYTGCSFTTHDGLTILD